MSLMIKGMNMPMSCWRCNCRHLAGDLYFCKIMKGDGSVTCVEEYNDKRHPDCPLIEVPTPHGDLIDRDDLLYEINRLTFVERYDYNTAYDAVALAETIIEAEGEG